MKIILILSLVFVTVGYSAQELLEKERELNKSLISLRGASTDEEMNELNIKFKAKMLDFLKNDGAMKYKFVECKTIAVLDSPDDLVRVITWNIEYTDFTYAFDGIVMFYDDRKEKVKIFELNDILDPYSERPTGVIDAKNWYGALYYQLIPFERNGKMEYVLLGWDGGTPGNNYKVIDVLTVSSSGVKFGSPIFKEKKQIHKRLIFEFSEQAKMTLTFEKKYNRIVMDHLSPESQSLAGVRSYYVPDMSYDAFYLEDDMWYLREDVIANNSGDSKRDLKYWKNPDDDGQVESVKHVPRTPESEMESTVNEVNFTPKKRTRTKRPSKNDLKVTTGKYKSKKKPRKVKEINLE